MILFSCSTENDYSSYITKINTDPNKENTIVFIDAVKQDASGKKSNEALKIFSTGLNLSVTNQILEGKKAFLVEMIKAMEELLEITVNNSKVPMSPDSLLYYLAEISSQSGQSIGLNKESASDYIIANSLIVPTVSDLEKKADLTFKAAEMANAIGDHKMALGLFDEIISAYSKTKKAPLSLFLKGFTYENNLEDFNNATFYYTMFLKKYPDHKLARDVQFLVDNIGKTGEELIEAARSNNE